MRFLIPPGEVGCCVAWELLSISLKELEAMVGEKASPLRQKPDKQKIDGRAATTENLAKYIFMILVTPPQDLTIYLLVITTNASLIITIRPPYNTSTSTY